MKFLINGIKSLLVGVWLVIAIFVTVCLLSYNEFSIPVIGKNAFIIINSDELEPEFKEGDLVIVKRDSDKNINIDDTVFFISGTRHNRVVINVGKVTGIEPITPVETHFQIEDITVKGEQVLGKAEGVAGMRYVGLALSILTSRWGYLFLVILPTLFFLVYEILLIVDEVKKIKKESLAEKVEKTE